MQAKVTGVFSWHEALLANKCKIVGLMGNQKQKGSLNEQ